MTATIGASGPAIFARYAFPPHELGYCGPEDAVGIAELGQRAHEFDGAWPYLVALARAGDAKGPLDPRAVRSYWVGGDLIDHVDPHELLEFLRRSFSKQFTGVLDQVDGALAHHSFQVLVVYPWVKFLRADPVTPLTMLQRCRVRWGQVTSVDEGHVMVESRPLTFDGHALALGEPSQERVRWESGGQSLTSMPQVGTWVSAHWDWICDQLTTEDVAALEDATLRSMTLVNGILARTKH